MLGCALLCENGNGRPTASQLIQLHTVWIPNFEPSGREFEKTRQRFRRRRRPAGVKIAPRRPESISPGPLPDILVLRGTCASCTSRATNKKGSQRGPFFISSVLGQDENSSSTNRLRFGRRSVSYDGSQISESFRNDSGQSLRARQFFGKAQSLNGG